MPDAVRPTNLDNVRASGRACTSSTGYERPWQIATAFSLIATMSPGASSTSRSASSRPSTNESPLTNSRVRIGARA